MSTVKISAALPAGSVVITCTGELTSESHEQEFANSFALALARRPLKMRLDCSNVSKVSRLVVTLLSKAAGRCAELGIAFELSIRPAVLRAAQDEVQIARDFVRFGRWQVSRQGAR